MITKISSTTADISSTTMAIDINMITFMIINNTITINTTTNL